jgi:hypothetical protein
MNRALPATSPSASREAVDGCVQAVVEIDERVFRPETLVQLLTRDNLPGRSNNIARMRNGWSRSLILRPPCAARRRKVRLKTPKRTTLPGSMTWRQRRVYHIEGVELTG